MDTWAIERTIKYLHFACRTFFLNVKQYSKNRPNVSKTKKPNKKLAMFVLENNKAGEPLLLHDEPIYNDKDIVGRTTSGNFSFNYNKNLAFGYVSSELINKDKANNQNLFIEVEKKKYSASIILKPLNNKNIRNI